MNELLEAAKEARRILYVAADIETPAKEYMPDALAKAIEMLNAAIEKSDQE